MLEKDLDGVVKRKNKEIVKRVFGSSYENFRLFEISNILVDRLIESITRLLGVLFRARHTP